MLFLMLFSIIIYHMILNIFNNSSCYAVGSFNYFKVYNSVTFSTLTMLYNHHLYLVTMHFHHRKR